MLNIEAEIIVTIKNYFLFPNNIIKHFLRKPVLNKVKHFAIYINSITSYLTAYFS